MRTGVSQLAAIVILAALPRMSAAQHPVQVPQHGPMPLPQHGPVSLEVPHPIQPVVPTPGPRDLYRQLTPPAPVIVSPGYGYGLYSPYGPFSSYGGYIYPGYVGSDYAYGPQFPMSHAEAATVAQGGLRFQSSPGSAQVFVDGMYVGVADDFGMSNRALDLDAGTHRVELRAPGYTTVGFDINVGPNETRTYRGDLQQLPRADQRQQPAVRPAPKTTYVIPNCYAGDRPPTRTLRPGCEISKMVVRKP